MKLKTLTPIDHNGKVYQPGDVFECDDVAAKHLLDAKAATEETAEAATEETAEAATEETAEAATEEKAKGKGKGKK